jgi:hypothetical protein
MCIHLTLGLLLHEHEPCHFCEIETLRGELSKREFLVEDMTKRLARLEIEVVRLRKFKLRSLK